MITYDFNMQAKNADVKVQIQIVVDPRKPNKNEQSMVESLHRHMMDCQPIILMVGDKEYVFLPDSITQSAEYIA